MNQGRVTVVESTQKNDQELKESMNRVLRLRDMERDISSVTQGEECFEKFTTVCDEIDAVEIEKDEGLQELLLGLISSVNKRYYDLEGKSSGAHPVVATFISRCINRSLDSKSSDLLLETIFSDWETTQYLASYFERSLDTWEEGDKEKKLNLIKIYLGREKSYDVGSDIRNHPRAIIAGIGGSLEKSLSPSKEGPEDGDIAVRDPLDAELKRLYTRYLEIPRIKHTEFFKQQMSKFLDKGYFVGGIDWACDFLKTGKYFYPGGGISLNRERIQNDLVKYSWSLNELSKTKYFVEKMIDMYDEDTTPGMLDAIFQQWIADYQYGFLGESAREGVPLILEFFKNDKAYKNIEFMRETQRRFLKLYEELKAGMERKRWEKEVLSKEIVAAIEEGSNEYLKQDTRPLAQEIYAWNKEEFKKLEI